MNNMKKIEEAAKDYALSREDNDYTIETEMAFTAGVEFAQRWIPVSKELPEHWVAVLVKLIDRSIPVVATLNVYDMCWYFYDSCDNEWYGFASVKNITHWRPIELL
jgi:hypothetical protein